MTKQKQEENLEKSDRRQELFQYNMRVVEDAVWYMSSLEKVGSIQFDIFAGKIERYKKKQDVDSGIIVVESIKPSRRRYK